jgi:hypothetical protein
LNCTHCWSASVAPNSLRSCAQLNGPLDAVRQALQAAGRSPQALFLELHHLVDEALAPSAPMRLRCGTRTSSK